jgi:hypothetical protein
MDELDGADLGKGGKVFHEKAVAGALGVNPLVIVKAKVSTGLIKKFPGVGEVAWVDVEALGMAWFAEDGPGYSGLQLEMVEGDGECLADFVTFAEVGDNELGVLDALFRFEVEDAHAAEVDGAMTDGSGGGAVDAHLREEGGEVCGLEFLALLSGEAGGAQWVL